MKLKDLRDLPETSSYLDRINAEPRSLLKCVVMEQHGDYWQDVSVIRFEKNGEISVSALPDKYDPTDSERELIKNEFANIDWPNFKYINMSDPNLPDLYSDALPQDRFEFSDANGNVVMLQVKKVQKGQKSYIPITYWSDEEYRFAEPDGLLPLWGLDKIKEHTTAFIHEGASSARAGRAIAEGKFPEHPWALELSNAVHLGFIGGALSPLRTDWSVLKKFGITRVYIVADNDHAGRTAVPKIAKELRCPTFFIQFTDQFPTSFDMADKFPDRMFRAIGEKKYYTGPSFREVTNPATYMTDIVHVDDGTKKGKDVPVLREHAKGQWIFAEELGLFVNAEMPDIVRSPEQLDMMLMSFSDKRNTSELILSAFIGRTPKFAYNPAFKGRRVISSGTSAINLYIPPDIRPADGDATPWLEYMEYMIPDEKERYEVLRWCATLIARPEIRMTYALLLISEMTGTGKSTLGKILSRLVGPYNTSFPTESTILETFNSWIAKKRLVVVNEIYQGNSFKAANKLKTYITDETISMRLMFRDSVDIENYAHFCCFSNSLDALRMEDNDRRWYVPTLTEEKRSTKEWQVFFDWLENGGYSIIFGWAEKFEDYVIPGDRAPASKRKDEMIQESRSLSEREVLELCESINARGLEVAFSNNDLFAWATFKVKGQVYDKPLTLQRLAKEQGFTIWNGNDRMYINGRLQPVIISPKLGERIKKLGEKEAKDYVKTRVKNPTSILEENL